MCLTCYINLPKESLQNKIKSIVKEKMANFSPFMVKMSSNSV